MSFASRTASLRARVRSLVRGRPTYRIPELRSFDLQRGAETETSRLNIILPTIQSASIFGGASTALRFFEAFSKSYDRKRIVVRNDAVGTFEPEHWRDWSIDKGDPSDRSTISFLGGAGALKIEKNDVFIATYWTTALLQRLASAFQRDTFRRAPRPIYLIQDFEPGFFPWSSEWLLAESTYRDREDCVAVFNTSLLQDYYRQNGYRFGASYSFEPAINPKLSEYVGQVRPKEKQIIVYGRPEVPRNAFSMIVEALHIWAEHYPRAAEWKLLSLGAQHTDVDLPKGLALRAGGKVSLAQYAELLQKSSVGLSLMVSPHPSYPPLEMASFGLRVITNAFSNKDISGRGKDIHSLRAVTPERISEALACACDQFTPNRRPDPNACYFTSAGDEFPFLDDLRTRLAMDEEGIDR